MLVIKGIEVKAGAFALRDLNLTVEDGTCHVIIGPTGCGKTTLLETIIGLRKPSQGGILLNGKEISATPIEKRGLSYLPQDLAIFPHLTVKENIFYGLRVRGETDRRLYAFVDELVENLGISNLMDRRPRGLSGGERQRVALIRALSAGNKCLLLDEPLSALHEGMKREQWFLIKELQLRYGLTIVMVTHDTEEAFFLGDRISVMIGGGIHQSGPKDEVYRHPKTLEVAEFFGIRNIFEAQVTETSDDKMVVRCDELHYNLAVMGLKRSYSPSQRIFIGIRAENIMFVRPDLRRPVQSHLIDGNVSAIFKKGASHTVLFLPADSSKNIEIELPDHVLKKLNLVKGQTVTVFLKRECIFLMPEKGC